MKSITQVVESLIKPYIDSHDRAAEAIIAPVETDATSASDDYAVGKQLILNNVLYDVIAPITTGDALVVNTNIKAADNVSTDIQNIYEVMGRNGAKNLTPVPYFNSSPHTTNGITFTVNSDGSVTASGTASSDAYFRCTYASGDKHIALLADTDYIINGTGNASVAVILRDSTNTKVASARATDATYSCTSAGNYDIVLLVDNGTDLTTPLTIYPMVRFASDSDSTYQPYAKTNQELTAENQTLTNEVTAINNTLSTQNLLKYSLTSGTSSEVVYTVNSDKTISVTTTGATESARFIDLQADLSNLIHGETYILNGCPSGGSIGTYTLWLADGTNDYIDTGNGVQFVYDSNKTYALRFVVYASVNLTTPIVFKPMIRLASIWVVTSGTVTSDQTTVSTAMADLYSKIEAVTSSLSAGQLLVLKRVSIAQTRAADVPITFAHHNLNDVIYANVNEVGVSAAVLANFIISANSANNSAFLCVIDANGATFSNEISKTISGTSSITYDIVECA